MVTFVDVYCIYIYVLFCNYCEDKLLIKLYVNSHIGSKQQSNFSLSQPIMQLSVVRTIILMLAPLVESRTLGSQALPVISRSGKAFPKCTPGQFTCSGPFSFPVELNCILTCDHDGNWELSAQCGGNGCCKTFTNGLPYCSC
jgi:hypothetical protein